MIDIFKIREDFPILSRKVNGQNLIYFDNAATSQKPKQVIDVIIDYYTRLNSNIHRGVHKLSQEATEAYEEARIKIQQHFNVAKPYEIIFTSGTTEMGVHTRCFDAESKKNDHISPLNLEFQNGRIGMSSVAFCCSGNTRCKNSRKMVNARSVDTKKTKISRCPISNIQYGYVS